MKNFKKLCLLVTVIGATTFLMGSILQVVNLDPGSESELNGLNELTYVGAIALVLSLIVWLVILERYVFTDWNWLKSKTKADDIAALGVFTITTPILLSLNVFILYDLIIWCDWYIGENSYYEPLYRSVYGSLMHLERDMVFWFILITLISISSGLAIFLYKSKLKRLGTENQPS